MAARAAPQGLDHAWKAATVLGECMWQRVVSDPLRADVYLMWQVEIPLQSSGRVGDLPESLKTDRQALIERVARGRQLVELADEVRLMRGQRHGRDVQHVEAPPQ